MNGLIVIKGGNRMGALLDTAAFLDREDKDGNKVIDVREVSSRCFGGLGFCAIRFLTSSHVFTGLEEEVSNLVANIAQNRKPVSESDGLIGNILKAGGVQLARMESLDFQISTEEPVEIGRDAIQVARALAHIDDIRVVGHDGVLVPRLGVHNDLLPKYFQVIRCKHKLINAQHEIQRRLRTENINLEKYPVNFDPPPLGYSLSPEIFSAARADFHDGWYLYLMLDGPDVSGMSLAASDFLLRIQQTLVQKIQEGLKVRPWPRPGIIRSCSRAIGGHGLVLLAIAIPAKSFEKAEHDKELFKKFIDSDPSMGALIEKGYKIAFHISEKHPWHFREINEQLCFRAKAENKSGLFRNFLAKYDEMKTSNFVDFVEVDCKIIKHKEQPNEFCIAGGILIEKGVSIVKVKEELTSAAKMAELELSWRTPNVPDRDSSWS